MVCERRPRGLAQAGDNVEDPIGQAGVVQEFAQPQGDERGVLRGLDDDRITGGERGRGFVERHCERIVWRRDARDNAQRFTRRVIEELPGQREWDRVAEQLGGPARVILRPANGSGDFALRLPDRLAVFDRDELSEFLAMFFDECSGFLQKPAAIVGRDFLPGGKRAASGPHGFVGIRFAASGKPRERVARCGVERRQGLAAGRIAPLAAEHLRGLGEKRSHGRQ